MSARLLKTAFYFKTGKNIVQKHIVWNNLFTNSLLTHTLL